MSAPALRLGPALLSACFAVAFVPAVNRADEPSQSSSPAKSWTDAKVAEHASRLAGPDTIAVVHFKTESCKNSDYAAAWFDRFEKQIAGEALDELGVEEAVAVIDLGSFGQTATRSIVRMQEDYRDSRTCERDLRIVFAPLGEHVAFDERTLHIAPHERNVSVESRAALDVGCIEKRLAAVGPAPLRIVTVEPQKRDASFVSLPETPSSTSSAGTCLALAFDYRSSTGTLQVVSDGQPMELRIDEAYGRAPALRAFARMARVLRDELFATSVVVAEAPLAEELPEIALPPFGLPLAR